MSAYSQLDALEALLIQKDNKIVYLGATLNEQLTRIQTLEIRVNDLVREKSELEAKLGAPPGPPRMRVGAACPGGTEDQFALLEAKCGGTLDAARIFMAFKDSSLPSPTIGAVTITNELASHKGKRRPCLSVAFPTAFVKNPQANNFGPWITAINAAFEAFGEPLDFAANHEPFVKIKNGEYTVAEWVAFQIFLMQRITAPNVTKGLIHTAANYKNADEIGPLSPSSLLSFVDWMGADGYDWGTGDIASDIFKGFTTWCKANNKRMYITEAGFDATTGRQWDKVSSFMSYANLNNVSSVFYFNVQDNNARSHTPDKHICVWPLDTDGVNAFASALNRP